MNTKLLIVAVLPMLALPADAAVSTNVSYNVNQTISDGNVNGLASSQEITGVGGVITSITVQLDISGGYNGDLYVYLSHLNGFSVLLNRVGRTAGDSFGYADEGFNITFDDLAVADVHSYGGAGGAPLTGNWQVDGRNSDPATVVDTTGRSAYLDTFTGLSPDGTWTLFIADMSGGAQSTLNSWGMTITSVPEPSSMVLVGVFGGVFALGRGLRAWRRRARD